MLTLQKDFDKLIRSCAKAKNDFNQGFINSLTDYLNKIYQKFPYFKSLGFCIRSYYHEELDFFEPPILEAVAFNVDSIALNDLSIGFGNWYEKTMIPGNVTSFPSIFYLGTLTSESKIFVDEDFHQCLLELRNLLYGSEYWIIQAICFNCESSNIDIVFNCAEKNIDIGEF